LFFIRNLQTKIEVGQSQSGGDNSNASSSSASGTMNTMMGQVGGVEPPLRLPLSFGQQQPSPGGGMGIGHSSASSVLSDDQDSQTSQNCFTGRGGMMGGLSRNSILEGDVITLSSNVQHLRNEVDRLKAQLNVAQQQRKINLFELAVC